NCITIKSDKQHPFTRKKRLFQPCFSRISNRSHFVSRVDGLHRVPLIWPVSSQFPKPEWRNWYTHQTQNLARFTPHESSSLSSGTNFSFFQRKVLTFLRSHCYRAHRDDGSNGTRPKSSRSPIAIDAPTA